MRGGIGVGFRPGLFGSGYEQGQLRRLYLYTKVDTHEDEFNYKH